MRKDAFIFVGLGPQTPWFGTRGASWHSARSAWAAVKTRTRFRFNLSSAASVALLAYVRGPRTDVLLPVLLVFSP